MAQVLTTKRLTVRRAESSDAGFVESLWTMPAVMRLVGFPEGIALSADEVRRTIESGQSTVLGSILIVSLSKQGQIIGQAKVGAPDAEGISEPDIKLHPEYWGCGYGKELWPALIDYAFKYSSADIVQGTPNRDNTASVRMQIGAGMVQVDEGVFPAAKHLHPEAVPVPYLKLHMTRRQWQSRHQIEFTPQEEDVP
ncbi:GNAT family N-acetyltransferase [Candidatus Bipolaricaulota bacterium]